jgi:hypothetical protein
MASCKFLEKLNATTNKDLYPLLFMDEMLDKVVGGKVYFFLNIF